MFIYDGPVVTISPSQFLDILMLPALVVLGLIFWPLLALAVPIWILVVFVNWLKRTRVTQVQVDVADAQEGPRFWRPQRPGERWAA